MFRIASRVDPEPHEEVKLFREAGGNPKNPGTDGTFSDGGNRSTRPPLQIPRHTVPFPSEF
jgi:hypothetical protein